MRIEIQSDSEVIDKHFGYYLIDLIRDEIRHRINPIKLVNLNQYIEENNIFKSVYRKRISCEEIIIIGSRNLICRETATKLIIEINNNALIPGLDRVKINSACKLINYGTVDIKGYPIFTTIFNEFTDNINLFVKEYLEEI